MKETEIVPQHLALIPDGNRRWAKKNSLNLFMGYKKGIQKFLEFGDWSKDAGVKMLTVWALSTENLTNRSSHELNVLFHLYAKAARDKAFLERLDDTKTRIKFIGDMSALPAKLRRALKEVEAHTKNYKNFTINMLINYGGREDILHAVRKLASKGKRINDELVAKCLRTAGLPDVDLVVRTSGEMRLSGLLPWQAAYSELYFAEKYWPEFEKKDFDKAISSFSRRQRRYGK